MPRCQSRRALRQRIYLGRIVLGDQPKRWIKKKKSFASKNWLEGQIRYGLWERVERKRRRYDINVHIIEAGTKQIPILIKFTHYPNGRATYPFDHVFVFRTHVKKIR